MASVCVRDISLYLYFGIAALSLVTRVTDQQSVIVIRVFYPCICACHRQCTCLHVYLDLDSDMDCIVDFARL